MSWKIFAELVELKAKAASVFPFVIGMAYAWYHYKQINGWNMLLFFIAMFLFNMAVDILDNYMDYQHATEVHDYKEKTNIIGRENLSLIFVRNLMLTFIVVSASIGIYLSWRTSWIVLFLGIISYSVGIFYSAGPKPLSRMPIGEIASGVTMGLIIPLICVYLNVYDRVAFDGTFVGKIAFMSLPAICAIANLMLANNTCDLEEDTLNNRHTLVYYIGQQSAVRLFQWLAYIPFVTLTLSVILQIVPWTVLLTWLVFPKIYKNTQAFAKQQVKLVTFPLAVNNLAITIMAESFFFVIGIFH